MEDSDVKNIWGRRDPRIRTFILRGSMQLRYKTTIHNTEKLPRPRVRHKRAHTHILCASRHSRNLRHHFTRAFLYRNFQEKIPRPKLSPERRDMRVCAIEMHINISQMPLFIDIYKINTAARNRGANFMRAYAIDLQFNISQKPF